MRDTQRVMAKGFISLYEETTGKELIKQNMVLKNSPHVTALAFGSDIKNITIKAGTWGDNFVELPTGSYFNMTNLECMENIHSIDENHTVKQFSITGHSYPGSKSIRYSFRIDRNNGVELLDKNILEWGLYFNNILFSRVALQEDFYFRNWMKIVGTWTIVFMNCSGGYSNYLLNQYTLESLWGMDYVNTSNYTIPDYAGSNHLTCVIPPSKLIGDLIGVDANVTSDDFLHKDSLVTFHQDDGEYNILKIENDNIINDSLDLTTPFTLWQWFKFKDIDSSPFVLPINSKWILCSKWISTDDLDYCSYRLYLERGSSDVKLKFDINNNGTLITLESDILDVDSLSTVNILNEWCLAIVSYNSDKGKISLYLNGNEVDSEDITDLETPSNDTTFFIGAEQVDETDSDIYDTNSVFKGFIDETGISKEAFSDKSIMLLWNNGYGDFFNE